MFSRCHAFQEPSSGLFEDETFLITKGVTMQRQTYADNVDSNGVAYKTVGDNIREGAKDAKSVVKALQSEDITFDMQAIMNVLPFMDSTKKIVEVNISASNGKWISDKYMDANSEYGVALNIPVYGCLIGEIKRGDLITDNKMWFNTSAKRNTNHLYVNFYNRINSEDNTAGTNIKLYVVTDKTVVG